jgi:hypothetical protein
MGMPALLKEGLSWKDVRLRAMSGTPVKLPPLRDCSSQQGSVAVER